jgi:TolB-like protein/Tfp pilus assembly protein PilF
MTDEQFAEADLGQLSDGAAIPSSAVLNALQGALNSVAFSKSPRLARFLRYIVERSLDGASDAVKEYAIGIDVFDRPANYDQRLDPIVRVEARRLRGKLSQYYAQEGAVDPIRIEIPARGYQPVFRTAGLQPTQPVEPPALTEQSALAVLPFAALSQEPADSLFADGLTDEISFLLGSIDQLQVVSRSSALQYKGRAYDVRAIGAELEVDYILEGTVRREGDVVRVAAQLVNTAYGFRVWSGIREQRMTGTLETQKAVAEALAGELVARLNPSWASATRKHPSGQHSSYSGYLRGRCQMSTRTDEGIRKSIGTFRQVIDKDPEYALAYAGLADAYSLGARYDVFPAQDSWQRAREAAISALAIDDTLPEAHTALAFIELHRWNWLNAEKEFSTAIFLNPDHAPARQWYAWYLILTGQFDSAIRNLERAHDLDPLSPNVSADIALARYYSRDYESAIAQCRKTLDLAPGFYRPHHLLGLAFLQQRRFAEAAEQFRTAVALSRGNPKMMALLAHAYAAMGKRDDSERIASELIHGRRSYLPASDAALLFSAAGDSEGLFGALEKAFQEQDGELIWLSVDPIHDQVREDERFHDLLRRIAASAASPAAAG